MKIELDFQCRSLELGELNAVRDALAVLTNIVGIEKMTYNEGIIDAASLDERHVSPIDTYTHGRPARVKVT